MAITSKKINLRQLDNELGGEGLIANMNDPTAKLILPSEFSNVTEAELAAGIAAHVAIFPINTRTSGITHALSLGFTQAQAEAMFP